MQDENNMDIILPLPDEFDNLRLFFRLGKNRKRISSPNMMSWLAPAMAIGACMANNEGNAASFEESGLLGLWKKMTESEKITESNLTVFQLNCLFSDVLLFTSFAKYKEVKNYLSKEQEILKKNKEVEFEGVRREIQKNVDDKVSNYNKAINDLLYNRAINDLLKSNNIVNDGCSKDFYALLLKELEDHSDDGPLMKEYLSNKGKMRCFATYVTENEKFISFSGFCDTDDTIILNWLGKTRQSFVDIADKICKKLGAIFVKTCDCIYTYTIEKIEKCEEGQWQLLKIKQEQSLNDLINGSYPNYLQNRYSCCERKIIAYFDKNNKNMPNGSLYIKLPMCEQCVYGVLYKNQDGVLIDFYEGLLC